MKINIKRSGRHDDVSVIYYNTTIQLGLLDCRERADLAGVLLQAVYELVSKDFKTEELYLDFVKSNF